MNIFVSRVLGVALAAAVMAGAAVSACAQQAQFHLTVPAKWGISVLPPGNYTMTLPDRSAGRSAFVVRGPAGTTLVLPLTVDAYGARSEASAGDFLELVRIDGAYFVEKYEAGRKSLTFFFKTPKPSLRVQMSGVKSVKVPVS
jgi:hypothetical protein